MHEASRYLKNRDGVGAEVRRVLRETVLSAWREGAEVLLIGHSLGSVIAYDTLWELTHVQRAGGKVSVLVTLGSPLGTRFVQRSVQGGRELGAARYPHNVRRWVNLTARGDTTALKARLQPLYHEMRDLGLVEAIEDFVEFDNYFRGELGLNAHEAYGYLAQRTFAEVLGDWLERSF
jgi:pimeloyl-ACP methyl ester carboxylesterase